MGVYIWETNETHNLPSAYQEVEYIEGSGTQWIDTGVTATQNTMSQIKFRNLSSNGAVIYGYCKDNDNADYRLFSASNIMYFDFGSSRISGSHLYTWTDYELELGNYYVKNVGASTNILTGTTISSYTSAGTIKLSYHDNNIISSDRWYYVKIRDGATQIRDFVPCYRKSDDEIGMYDLVNDVFYTNSGTGTFTKGPDVNEYVEKELLNAYIGEYAEPTATLDVDFTTLSSLDGFTVSSNGGTQLNSNGLSWQTSSRDRILDIYHDLPGSRTNAKKITMTMELYGNYRSWGLMQWFELLNTDGNKGIGGNISFNNNDSLYQLNSIGMVSGTTLASRTQANPTGTYTYTIEVDLVTGEWSGGYTGPNTFSGSGTLTSAQIDEIMQTTRIHVDIRGQQADYNWLRKLNVTIEY